MERRREQPWAKRNGPRLCHNNITPRARSLGHTVPRLCPHWPLLDPGELSEPTECETLYVVCLSHSLQLLRVVNYQTAVLHDRSGVCDC